MLGLISDDAIGKLVDLLAKEFGVAVDRTVISFHVAAAVRDLRGSIYPEALPEMACRLASHRLSELVQGQAGNPSRIPLAQR